MQNRTHRNLLFNSRATAGTDSTSNSDGAELLESDNQKSVEHLRGSALTIKDIALHVDASVNDQNRMLDKMVCLRYKRFLVFASTLHVFNTSSDLSNRCIQTERIGVLNRQIRWFPRHCLLYKTWSPTVLRSGFA